MSLKKKASRGSKVKQPISFRVSESSVKELKILSEALNLSQTEILEQLIKEAYSKASHDYSSEIRKAKRKLG